MNSICPPRALVFLLGALFVFSPRMGLGEDAYGDYKVSPQDILVVAVVGEKELTQECRVSSSGTITYAWLSNVEVGGKTAAQIEQLLRQALDKDYLVDPTVLVAIKEYRQREVTVTGMVNKPGNILIPAEQPMTIMDVIGRAGGVARGGDANKIHFSRRGEKEKTVLKMDDLLKVTDPEKMIYVQPGDLIEVKEKFL